MRKFNFVFCVAGLLATFTFSPAYAQKGKNVSRFLKAQANNPAFAQALQHAQAAAAARSGTQLPAAKAIASENKINSQIQLSHASVQPVNPTYIQKSPQQRLKDLEEFVQTYRRFPKHGSVYSAHESSIRQWADRFVRKQNHVNPVVQRIFQIRKQYPTAPSKKNGKSPQQWLDELESFIQRTGHYPILTEKGPNDAQLYHGVANALDRLEVDDPVAIRLRQLRKEYPPELVIRRGKNPQQWLDELETFIRENGRYPSQANYGVERSLYANMLGLIRRIGKEHPVAVRILQLRQDYPPTDRKKTSRQWLNELETFIHKNGRYPSPKELGKEHALYTNTQRLLTRLSKDHAVSIRIQQLRQEYCVEQ